MAFLPIEQMRDRLARDQTESDVAAFHALMYYGELMVKTVVAALVSALADDPERQRYGFLHRLVRANGIGEWSTCLRELCTGPASQLLDSAIRDDRRQITQHASKSKWQSEAVARIHECAATVASDHPELVRKVSLEYSMPAGMTPAVQHRTPRMVTSGGYQAARSVVGCRMMANRCLR